MEKGQIVKSNGQKSDYETEITARCLSNCNYGRMFVPLHSEKIDRTAHAYHRDTPSI